MRKNKFVIIILVLTLALSNLWWAYKLLDAGISATYMTENLKGHKEVLSQTMAILRVVARSNSTQTDILKAAPQHGSLVDSFKKDGFTRISQIGLSLNHEGRLIEVKPAFE